MAETTKTAPNRGEARAFIPSLNTFSKIPSVSFVPLLLRQLYVHHIGSSFVSSDRASKPALYLKMLLESCFLLPKASLLTFLLCFFYYRITCTSIRDEVKECDNRYFKSTLVQSSEVPAKPNLKWQRSDL